MPRAVRHILFDLGVVLLHLRYERALTRLYPHCDPGRVADAGAIFSLVERDPVIEAVEKGAVEFDAVFARFVERTGYHGTRAVFEEAWNSIFDANEPMLAFAGRLARRYDVFLATNADRQHLAYIMKHFPGLSVFKDCAASCELGAVKPTAPFYERALVQFGIAAETCLFIDDRLENVRGAEACGLRSVHYQEAAGAMADIEAILHDEPERLLPSCP